MVKAIVFDAYGTLYDAQTVVEAVWSTRFRDAAPTSRRFGD